MRSSMWSFFYAHAQQQSFQSKTGRVESNGGGKPGTGRKLETTRAIPTTAILLGLLMVLVGTACHENGAPSSPFTLTVMKVGGGNGMVTSSPPGLHCGTDCAEAYGSDTVVALTATPDPASRFTGWSGGPDCAEGQVTMTTQRSCTATFEVAIAFVTLEDFSDLVTSIDRGLNDFSGNTGDLNKDDRPYGQSALACAENGVCTVRFAWDFGVSEDQEAFTGLFMSLFGLTETLATFDGRTVETVSFPEHSLDLDRIDGALNEPGGPRRFLQVCVELSYQGTEELMLRMELKDTQEGARFTRLPFAGAPRPQTRCWDFRDPQSFRIAARRDLDIHQAKVLTFIIERQHVADGVRNPERGTLALHHIFFIPDRRETQLGDDQALLDLLARRTYQYFLDWSSRKAASACLPQDRSTFLDLLTAGGIGFALPAHIIAAERGWISRSDAARCILRVLRLLDAPDTFGPAPIGALGHEGLFYHFFGVDGRRKLNFDFPASPQNEALTTVELSTIDTGLALMGVLAAQSYFDRSEAIEVEMRQRAQAIYDRVNWTFMLEPTLQQFYLGWKPTEAREAAPAFAIPDAAGEGAYSGTPGAPATLDIYTDEALIVLLLAMGSTTHPVPAGIYCALARVPDAKGLIRTFPGGLFTYLFLHAFLDTSTLSLPACPDEEDPINWFENSRQAIQAAMTYAEENPRGFQTYGPEAWGLSAAEGPDDQYHAYGPPPLALHPAPEEDGTVTYYAMMSAVSFGADLRQRALAALRSAWERGHWHPRFGLPDAFNDEISQANLAVTPGSGNRLFRQRGPWVQRALFAIDQGPMLLHLENARSGLLWGLMAQNPNIQRALARLAVPAHLFLEGEQGSGHGHVMQRSAASGQRTVQLQAGESRTLAFELSGSARYAISVRYSNDNFGPLETVTLSLDGDTVGQFTPQDTGDFGAGWNVFASSGPIGVVTLQPGAHQLVVAVSGGDGFGVEIDGVTLDRAEIAQEVVARPVARPRTGAP